LTGWFINLKKWQKGGLIGCAVGVLFACLLMLGLILGRYLDSHEVWNVGWWIIRLHCSLHVIFALFMRLPYLMPDFATSGAIVVCYGGFGAIVGKVQQMTNPFWKWLLTGLLVIFLLFIYWFNLQVARWAENL